MEFGKKETIASEISESVSGKSFISTLIVAVVTSALSILTIILTAKAVGPLPISLSQTISQKQSTFNVTGSSELSVIPDVAEVSLGLEVLSPTAADAQNRANQVMSQLIDSMQELGIEEEDIQTQNYSVFPEYSFEEGSRQSNGFRVSTNVRVKIRDFANINQAIDRAVAVGATNVGGINFTLSEEAEEEALKQAREEAIADAKEDAQELARLAGMKLGKIVNVTEGRSEPPVTFSRSFEAAALAEDAAPTQIEPGSNTFNYTVTLSYETL